MPKPSLPLHRSRFVLTSAIMLFMASLPRGAFAGGATGCATEWTQLAENGEDPHSLDAPAPVVSVTAAAAGGHGEHAETEDADAGTGRGQGEREVDGHGRFADAAFAGGDGDHAGDARNAASFGGAARLRAEFCGQAFGRRAH